MTNTKTSIRSVSFTLAPSVHTKLREVCSAEFMSASAFSKKATLRAMKETARRQRAKKQRRVSK